MLRLTWTAVALWACLTSSTLGQPLRILTFDKSRSVPCGNDNFAFVTCDVHSAARAEVLDLSNFGENGVIPRQALLDAPVPFIDGQALTDADVVLINSIETPLNPCEVLCLRDFVLKGGGVLAFYNYAAQSLGPVVDAIGGNDCGGGGDFSFVNENHPILQGPFGDLAGVLDGEYHCRFSDIGKNGRTLVQSTGPVGVAFELGAGRVFIINDEEWAMNTTQCPAIPGWDSKSRILFLNALAWIMPPDDFQYEPLQYNCYPDCDQNCELDLFDFLCFTNSFNSEQGYADCDGNGSHDLFDFLCFVNAFNTGC